MSREHLQTLTEIRSLMERSSKFLSLSGLSGISAGVVALLGAATVYLRLRTGWFRILSYDRGQGYSPTVYGDVRQFLIMVALCTIGGALLTGLFFTLRKARRQGVRLWNATSRRLLWAMGVPLVTGGIFCLALLHYRLIWLTPPATLIFYGLALINGSKYTVRDVEYLGLSEIGLGLIALFVTGFNLLAWAVGFGLLHIIYGAAMYWKYDRVAPDRVPAGTPERGHRTTNRATDLFTDPDSV